MQRIHEIRELFEYNRWADDRLLRAVADISFEQFTRDMGSSFRSVRDTLVHILSANWVWLSRWEGVSPREMPREWKEVTPIELRRAWRDVESKQATYVNSLDDSDLDRVIRYMNMAGERFSSPLWQMLRHVVNHATYHRGQVTTMLRQLGLHPASTDMIAYFRESSAEPARLDS